MLFWHRRIAGEEKRQIELKGVKHLLIIQFYLQADKAKSLLFDSFPLSKCHFDYFSKVILLKFTEPFLS